MPKMADRVTPLPAGLIPLLTQREVETLYRVSDWQVLQWIKEGMPVEPFKGRQRRFDLEKVRAWHAEQDAPEDAEEPSLVAASV